MGKQATHPEQQRLRKIKDSELETKSSFGYYSASNYFADRSGSSAKMYGKTRKKKSKK